MNTSILLLIIISYTIGFVFLRIIRSYDKYDKEPMGKLVLFSFVGGIVSILVASFLYLFVHPKYNFVDAVLKVGPVEEAAKLITLFIIYKMIKKEYDEIVDGIIYIAAISLGFSVIENITYAMRAANPYPLLAQRFIFATIGHISFSVYMGIAFYVHKKIRKNYLGLLFSFILASLAHGLYDGFIFNQDLVYFFIPTYALLIYFQFRLLKISFAYSKLKKKLQLQHLKSHSRNYNLQCCNCNNTEGKLSQFEDIDIYFCNSCENVIIDKDDFGKLLKYFRPKLNQKKFTQSLDSYTKNIRFNTPNSMVYYIEKERLNSNFKDLENWLKEENKNDIIKYKKSIEGFIFRLLGFRLIKL